MSPNPFAETEEFGYRHSALNDALTELPERERDILIERRLKDDPVTLEELGQIYGISRERVRQLEARAFEKIKKLIRAAAQNDGVALTPTALN